jgi:hypothetical protein
VKTVPLFDDAVGLESSPGGKNISGATALKRVRCSWKIDMNLRSNDPVSLLHVGLRRFLVGFDSKCAFVESGTNSRSAKLLHFGR